MPRDDLRKSVLCGKLVIPLLCDNNDGIDVRIGTRIPLDGGSVQNDGNDSGLFHEKLSAALGAVNVMLILHVSPLSSDAPAANAAGAVSFYSGFT